MTPRFGSAVENVTIKAYVPQSVALLAGSTKYGSTNFEPTESDLSELTHDERQWLADRLAQSFSLPVPTVTWAAIVAVLRADIARVTTIATEEAERLERQIVTALAKPDADWFEYYNPPQFSRGVPRVAEKDPRVVARYEALRPELDRRIAAYNADVAARAAAKEADTIAKDAARAAAVESIRAWALASDDEALARAARDGYEVTDAVLKRVAGGIASSLGGETSKEGTSHWGRWTFAERCAPSAEAFNAYDMAKAAIAALDKPEAVAVALESIARVTVAPAPDDTDDEPEIYTGLVVFVTSPDTGTKDRAVLVNVEA